MNILFVFNIFPGPGGLESVSCSLMGFLGRCHKVFSLSVAPGTGGRLPENISGSFFFPDADKCSRILFYNELVHDLGIDCAVNQGIYPELTDIIFNENRDTDVKVISVLHGMPGYEKIQFWSQDYIRNAGLYKRTERRLLAFFGLNSRYSSYIRSFRNSYRKAAEYGDRVVLLARKYEECFTRQYHLEKFRDKILSINNPVPSEYSCQPEPDISRKENWLLFTGRLSAEKRVEIIIRMWKAVRRDGWKLYIVGDGPEKAMLEKMAKGYDDICFTGYMNDPSDYYRKSRMLLLVSAFEGFSMSIIEAECFGTVPVAYVTSLGIEEALSDVGVKVKNNGFRSLCSNVSYMMACREELDSLALKAYAKSKSYSLDRIGRIWLDMLESL